MRKYAGLILSFGLLIALLTLASGGQTWAGGTNQTIPTVTTGAGPETPVVVPTGLVGGAIESASTPTPNLPADPLPIGCIALAVGVPLIVIVIVLFVRRPRAKVEAEQK